jgi:preprotein translocase subunit SecG
MKLNNFEAGSIAGAVTSIGAGLTLERVGVVVGILTALLTFGLNAIYMYRKDRREQVESSARLDEIHQHGGAK